MSIRLILAVLITATLTGGLLGSGAALIIIRITN